MRERMKGRKKPGDAEAQKQGNAPIPLQPKYFDTEPAETPAAAAASPEPEVASEPAARETPTPVESETSEIEAATPEARRPRRADDGTTRRPSRRRRGRGGRGGKQRSAEAAPAVAPESGGAAPDAVPEVAAVPAVVTEAVPAAARASKGTVVLAIGLPGSGKTTWFKRHEIRPLSSDMMRTLLFDDVREQRFQDLVFSNLRSMLKARLIARRPMNYVDATNLTPQERQHWIKLAKDFGYEVHALFFDVPLEVCVERHQRRDRVVPEDVMRRMAAKMRPPSFAEGFAKITVVRVKKKDEAPAE